MNKYFLYKHIKPISCLMTALAMLGCNDDVDPKTINSTGDGSSNRRGAVYLTPPYSYAQSPLSFPGALNDPLLSSAGAWSTVYHDLWGFESMGMATTFSSLNTLSLPSPEIIVAVIDTGIDYDAPDLAGKVWLNPGEQGAGRESNGVDDDGDGYIDDFMGWNWVNGNNHPVDDAGHGTHVSGTIAATGGNGLGIVGVAPWVRIMPLKVCDSQGRCNTSNVRSAMAYAVSHGAKVINLSLGGPNDAADASAFESATSDAKAAGVTVIVAAGNGQTDALNSVPGNATYAMAIAANASDGEICSSFSNYGWKIDVSAPGCGFDGLYEIPGVLSLNSKKCGSNGTSSCCPRTPINGNYCTMMGTSMAAPHVTGLAALALTAAPSATPLMVRQAILRASAAAATMTAGDKDRQHGNGLANSAQLIQEAQTAPGIKITSPRFNASSASHDIHFTVETRAATATYELRYLSISTSTQHFTLNAGTSISSGGPLAANATHDLSQTWTPPSDGTYAVILEVTVGAQKYYDALTLRKP